jgi:TetR/AcrR family transcriptional repressor of uid operon
MAELAKRAGMSVGHIYHYFENKGAIIEAIVERDLARMLTNLERFAEAEDAEEALIASVTENLVECASQQRLLLRLEVLAEASRSPRIAARVREADATARRRFLDALRSHQAFTQMPDADLGIRADAIVALIEGLTLRALRNPDLDIVGTIRELRPALHVLMQGQGAPQGTDA